MSRRIVAVLALALVVGCGSEQPAPAPPAAGVQAPEMPAAQMHKVLEGLRSNNPRTQYAALEMLAKFPTVVQTYREQIERLQQEAKDARIRKKAAELLASVEEPPASK